jgi:hypothetical protein
LHHVAADSTLAEIVTERRARGPASGAIERPGDQALVL